MATISHEVKVTEARQAEIQTITSGIMNLSLAGGSVGADLLMLITEDASAQNTTPWHIVRKMLCEVYGIVDRVNSSEGLSAEERKAEALKALGIQKKQKKSKK